VIIGKGVSMRKLIMWNVISLDGYFEGEKPWDLDFHQTVWGKELEEYSIEQLGTADMLVFGSKTYTGMADYWIKAEGQPEAEPMNEIPKIVCSTTLETADWNNTTIVKDAVADIPKLKQQGDGNMFVFGSSTLSESLMKADLFDEYRLCVAPLFLGKGRQLFNEGLPYKKLELLQERRLQTGGVILMYAPTSK
jgi:dihydrofolate reductase